MQNIGISPFFFVILINIVGSKRPLFNIEMVSNAKEMPKDTNYIKIPGFRGSALICSHPNKVKRPKHNDDPTELLTTITGKHFTILNENDKLEICIDGESRFNSASLGFHSGFEFRNGALLSYTEKGARCNKTQLWSLTVEYQCDNTVPKSTFYIPAFWKDDECIVHAIVKTSNLCKHRSFSDEEIVNIKCISEIDYSHSSIPDLY